MRFGIEDRTLQLSAQPVSRSPFPLVVSHDRLGDRAVELEKRQLVGAVDVVRELVAKHSSLSWSVRDPRLSAYDVIVGPQPIETIGKQTQRDALAGVAVQPEQRWIGCGCSSVLSASVCGREGALHAQLADVKVARIADLDNRRIRRQSLEHPATQVEPRRSRSLGKRRDTTEATAWRILQRRDAA